MRSVQVYESEHSFRLLDAKQKITCIWYFHNRADTDHHQHSCYELHVCTKGCTRFILDFHETIDLNEGEWILLGKGVFHEEKIVSPCGGYCLNMEITAPNSSSPFHKISTLHHYKGNDDPIMGDLLRQVMLEAECQKQGYEEYCTSLLTQLMIHIARSCSNLPSRMRKQETRRIDNLFVMDDFFNQIFHYADPGNLTIEALSEKLHMTPRHLNRLLTEYYGMSFSEKLQAEKMRFGKYLLETTDYSIGEISEICGVTPTYFIRCFKKRYAITPAQYRKSYKTDTD